MIVQIVRFKSGLSDERVLETYKGRAPRYRALKSLIQKYYLRFPATGEHGVVYVWESELGGTISTAYQVQGAADAETAEVVPLLRPDTGPSGGP